MQVKTKPKRVRLTLRISPALNHRLEAVAKKHKASVNACIVEAMWDALEIYENQQLDLFEQRGPALGLKPEEVK